MEKSKLTGVVFMADGLEEIEAVTIIDILRRGEICTQTVSIMDTPIITGTHGIKITCDSLLDDMLDNADILILPGGGPGTQNLKNHPKLAEILKKFNEEKKWLAAVCAAPTVLEGLGILNGRTAVCYPACEPELKSCKIGSDSVVVSENIITSKGPGTSAAFAFKIVEVLKDKNTADILKEQMIY